MKIGLYAGMDNGDVHDTSIDYIAVDKGLAHLLNQGITPVLAIGDFDSLNNEQLLKDYSIKKYNSIKDDSDTALALKYCIEKGYDEIDIYGVYGKRIDHFISVLCLLRQYPDIKITLYDEYNKLTLLRKGSYEIDTHDYKYFSCFAASKCHLTLKNCRYPLDHYLLDKDDPLVLSNQANNTLTLITDNDLIFIQSHD